MSTLANITSLNLSLQTGGAALAVKAVKSVAKPARTVYVFGTADDVAPNFSTVAGAVSYAQSLIPTITEPVVIRLFTKTDGTPYDLDGLDSWSTYAQDYLYIFSDFKRLNVFTSEIPSLIPAGLTAWYIDPNGVETLWVGREDGSAWPAVSENEYSVAVTSAFADGGGLTFSNQLKYSKLGSRVFIEVELSYTVQEMSSGTFLTINTIPTNARPASGKKGFGYVSFGTIESPPNETRFCEILDNGELTIAVNETVASAYSNMRISATYLTV
jgi:hypothetical protein